MSANYEWQKMQSNQQIQSRLNEAEVQRAVKQTREKHGFFLVRWVRKLFGTPPIESPQSDTTKAARQSRREEKAGYV